jgi:hypothetical protein
MPGTPKQFNTHKHPNANHQPRQKAADRKLHAQARQDVYNELTLEQKIAALPPEPYSKKQRARLMAALEKRNAPKPEPKAETKNEAPQSAEATVKQSKPKKYMKGSK